MAQINKVGASQREVRSEQHRMTVFVSYCTPVAIAKDGGETIVTDSKISSSTSRHIMRWMQGRITPTKLPQEDIDGILEELIGRSRLDPM